MEIRYLLNGDDLRAARQHLQGVIKIRSFDQYRAIFVWIAVGMLIGALLPKTFRDHSTAYYAYVQMLVVFLYGISLLWLGRWLRSERSRQWLDGFAGEYRLVLTPAGLSSSSEKGRVIFYAWPEIIAFEELDDSLYIYLRRNVALIIPLSSPDLSDMAHSIVAEVRHLWGAYPGNAGRSLPSLPTPASLFPARDIWSNLHQAARVALFQKFEQHTFHISRGQLFWLVLLLLLLIGIADYVAALPAPRFSAWGLSLYGSMLLLVFVSAAAISSAVMNRASMLALLVMMTSSAVTIALFCLPVSILAGHLSSSQVVLTAQTVLLPLWFIAVVFRIVRQMYGQPAPSALYLASLFALLTFVIGGYLPSARMYYNDTPDDENSSYSRARDIDIEDVFYRQPGLVDKALANINRARANKTDLYFIGFAGQAEEKVFANEVVYAKSLLERRFGAAGHSVALLNRLDTVNDIPLANAHNLEATLQGVAARMNKDDDVLFLYLSSHGAKNHSLSVSFWPMEFNDLKAEKLKAMLDKSGIRNRVIAVSACYSGGFLDVLKNDNTLVLTASSRDHVSYGCGDATEYTYFGEAYFVKSLAKRDSFITAFEDARQLIEDREKSEGKDRSNPQIYVGRNIIQKLESLEIGRIEKVARNLELMGVASQ